MCLQFERCALSLPFQPLCLPVVMVSPSGPISLDKPAHSSLSCPGHHAVFCFVLLLFILPSWENTRGKQLRKKTLVSTPGFRGCNLWWNGRLVLGLWRADYHGSRDILRRGGSPLSSQEMGEIESGLVLECFLLHFSHPGSHLLNGAVHIQDRAFSIRCAHITAILGMTPLTPRPPERVLFQ